VQITERRVGPVTILDLEGRLVLDEGDAPLIGAVNSLVARGQHQVLINLERVSSIDSAGLGALVAKLVSLARCGGRMKLLHLSPRTERPLRITKLTTVFETFDSEGEALRSFSSSNSAA
jgi:anti-sigma B factor antagonist